MKQPDRLSRKLLLRASCGDAAAMELVRRRVNYLHDTGRMGIASVLGEETPEHASVVGWLERGLQAKLSDMRGLGVSEEAQCQVFELVYPLVAHLARVRMQVVLRTAPSPCLLATALRLGRELLGAPQVSELRYPYAGFSSPRTSALGFGAFASPFWTLGDGDDQSEAMVRRTDESVRLLVEAGADLEMLDSAGHTPLLWVARTNPGNLALLAALIRHGAHVGARTTLGDNVLHCLVAWSRKPPASAQALKAFQLLVRIVPGDVMRELLGATGKNGMLPHYMATGGTRRAMLRAAAALELSAPIG